MEAIGLLVTLEACRGKEIAKALGARANELLAVPPQVEKVEVLASTPLKS